MGYFDDTYFDPTYFDTSAPVVAAGHAPKGPVVRPPLLTEDEDDLLMVRIL